MTRVLPVYDLSQSADAIALAAEMLRRGELVAFPTETVYGLGANALNASAVWKIFAAKGRPANNPLIVHVLGAEQARGLTAKWPDRAAALGEAFWPGPLSLVLPKREIVPDVVTAGAATVAIRAPAHPVARALLEATGLPIAAPSANRANAVSPTTAQHVLKCLGDEVGLILDAGPTSGGLESTVLDLSSDQVRLLRPGLVTPEQIERVIGPIERQVAQTQATDAPLLSPGNLPRHYAPRAPMELQPPTAAAERVEALADSGLQVGWLSFSAAIKRAGVTVITMPLDREKYATRLYAALHELDDAGVERIVVELPPSDPSWLAIHDRLRRGAT
jgi:L-threonylcarbamoyladenylate synthase